MNKQEVLDYSVFTSNLKEINFESKCIINTLNQYSYVIAEKDAMFKQALLESDILLPDGISIVAATRFLRGKKIKKIAGSDMHAYLLKRLNERQGSCFYLGSSEKTLIKIKKRLGAEYPSIRMEYYAPPFKAFFTEEENAIMVNHINAFKPNVLFVGMTAPKQEKWIFQHKDLVQANVICSIGAVFDYYSGNIKRAGKFWIFLGLEWLIRFINQPVIMWKRYLLYGPVFIYLILKEKLQISLKSRRGLV